MSSKWLFTFLLICFSVSFSAQVEDSVWVVTGKRYLGKGFKNWKPEVILDARRTVVGNEGARLFGLRIGVEHKRVNRWGLGLFGLDEPIIRSEIIDVDADVERAAYQFSYVSSYYERVLFLHPRWEWSAALHLGAGTISASYKLFHEEEIQNIDPISVKPIEISTSGYFNPIWWVSLGGGIGYRYMRETPPTLQTAYNGAIYIVKLKVKFGKMARAIFNKEVKDEY